MGRRSLWGASLKNMLGRTSRRGTPAHHLRRAAALPPCACHPTQVEAKRLGIPREVPLAVQQWEGLIAVNYAARARWVHGWLSWRLWLRCGAAVGRPHRRQLRHSHQAGAGVGAGVAEVAALHIRYGLPRGHHPRQRLPPSPNPAPCPTPPTQPPGLPPGLRCPCPPSLLPGAPGRSVTHRKRLGGGALCPCTQCCRCHTFDGSWAPMPRPAGVSRASCGWGRRASSAPSWCWPTWRRSGRGGRSTRGVPVASTRWVGVRGADGVMPTSCVAVGWSARGGGVV